MKTEKSFQKRDMLLNDLIQHFNEGTVISNLVLRSFHKMGKASGKKYPHINCLNNTHKFLRNRYIISKTPEKYKDAEVAIPLDIMDNPLKLVQFLTKDE